jgi:hypothetical protein
MIKFELIKPGSTSFPKNNVIMYFPGQEYVMLNGLQIKLDRVLDANENWVGCVLDTSSNQLIHFMEKSNTSALMTKHTARIVSTTPSEMALAERDNEAKWTDEKKEKKLSTMRLTQALILLKAAKRVSETMGEFMHLTRSFDKDMDREFPNEDSVKLGIKEFVLKHKGAASFRTMERTLKLIEEEAVEIMHEEMDIPSSKRARR